MLFGILVTNTDDHLEGLELVNIINKLCGITPILVSVPHLDVSLK